VRRPGRAAETRTVHVWPPSPHKINKGRVRGAAAISAALFDVRRRRLTLQCSPNRGGFGAGDVDSSPGTAAASSLSQTAHCHAWTHAKHTSFTKNYQNTSHQPTTAASSSKQNPCRYCPSELCSRRWDATRLRRRTNNDDAPRVGTKWPPPAMHPPTRAGPPGWHERDRVGGAPASNTDWRRG
jgi:hypothetical protein